MLRKGKIYRSTAASKDAKSKYYCSVAELMKSRRYTHETQKIQILQENKIYRVLY